MSKMNILVTGVGAVIGQGIIKSLRMSGLDINIVGIDTSQLAVGFHFCDDYLVCPVANSDDFIPWVIDTCKQKRIELILLGIPQDVSAFCTQQKHIEEKTKARLVLNSPMAIEVGNDKWSTHLFLKENNLPVPPTSLVKEVNIGAIRDKIGFPCLLKPRNSSAGKGIILVRDIAEYIYFSKNRDDFIVQKYVGSDDEEYTCGIFGMNNGTHTDVIVMKRKLSYGSTFQAEVDDYKEVKKVVINVVEKLKIIGPTNIQLRKHNGIPMVIEINPRFSSSTSLRAAFGFNEAEMCIRHFIFKEVVKPVIKKGFAQRYIEDLIVRVE